MRSLRVEDRSRRTLPVILAVLLAALTATFALSAAAPQARAATAADTTPPVVTLSVAGTLRAGSTNTYTGTVTVTGSATDNVRVVYGTYSVDGGPTIGYAGPFTVSGDGTHTVTASAYDPSNNKGSTTITFSINSTPVDTTPPTATINLSGTSTGTNSYAPPVTATINAADETGGSGLASVTYSLDGAAAQPYSSPLTITATGSHTLTATATDNAGNTFTTPTTSWTEQPVATGPTSGHVNFGTQTTAAISGYTLDYGQAYDATRGYGWEDNSTGAPTSLVGNGRERNLAASPDKRYDTMIQMQELAGSAGTTTVGRWQYDLANGLYNVTVAVGDASAINSTHVINAQTGTPQAKTIIDHFTETTGNYFQTVTKVVDVENGHLVLDPTGGTNTKIDYVDITPFTADTTAPTASISLSGSQVTGAANTYGGPVSVTVNASDNVAVTSTSYTVDGGASQTYSAPFTVSGSGNHTIAVSASDAAGNVGTATSTFTISPPAAPTSGHVNFGAQTTAAISGYALDYGQAYDAARGYGWEDNSSGAPLSLVGNGRERNSSLSPDKLHDTMMQMQELPGSSGVLMPGRWQYDLANGLYNVSVTVGDATATNSTHVINAQTGTPQAKTIIDHFTETTGNYFQTVTKVVDVENGHLVLDPTGGTNTKIDYVDITPASADTTAPTASISLSGTVRTDRTSTTYGGPVSVTVNASDNVAVTATTYTLDGGATQTYSGPFTVTGDGTHTVAVRASDAAGNVGTAASTFVIDTSPPAAPTSGHVNFGAQTTAAISGYTLDYGQAYDATRGYGWEDNSSGAPLSLVGNGRERNLAASPDKRYDTMVQMQELAGSSGVLTPGRWQYDLANGLYNVTVAVGDASAINSTHVINAQSGTPQAVTIIDHFTETTGNYFSTVTKVVDVENGHLVLDPTGGTNTKIDYVDITPAAADTTPPTASIALSGTQVSGGAFTPPVTATVTAADSGSGLASVTYSLDGATPKPYTAPLSITSTGTHTLTATATDVAGNVTTTAVTTWSEQASTTAAPTMTTDFPDSDTLAISAPRMVFSGSPTQGAIAPRTFTISNTGTAPLNISNLAISGTDAGSFALTSGQPTSFTIAAGSSATVSVTFTPTASTGCPSTSAPLAIGSVQRTATLTWSSNDTVSPTGSTTLSGLYACGTGSNNEPVLDQVLTALGYTSVAETTTDRRFIGPLRYLPNTDEIQSPYFTIADTTKPVTLTPVAHYDGGETVPFRPASWYAKGSTFTDACTSACHQAWIFPADVNATTFTQNQKLLPTVTGSTTITPTSPFGIEMGDTNDASFTDDSFNVGETASGAAISPLHLLHGIRVLTAYGPGHVVIPHTYLLLLDESNITSSKNNDFQDVVALLQNVSPFLPVSPAPGAATLNPTLTSGVTVSSSCAATGLDGVLPTTSGTACAAGSIAATSSGVAITSGAGQLTAGTQQNALYKNFDASQGAFTIRTRVVGGLSALTANTDQIGTFFGPDTQNFVKVEADHTGTSDPHLTFASDIAGTASTVTSVSVPAVSSASTLDLIIKGNTQVPDPIATASDTNVVHGYPLDQITAYYSINGGTPVQIGTANVSPADVSTWFSTNAKAGFFASNAGNTTPFTATFGQFQITAG